MKIFRCQNRGQAFVSLQNPLQIRDSKYVQNPSGITRQESLSFLRGFLILPIFEIYIGLIMKNNNQQDFKLWIEFEHVDFSGSNMKNEFCNIHVDLPDGRHYGINVWTYEYLNTAVKLDEESGENLRGLYITPPDLFVKELTRSCIKQVITDILEQGNIEDILNNSTSA
ncbi:hypothetical protein [Dysgonomonas sp. HDW5A]|uniref:hypothetical protein n=1 Tax=Dysgonomonas sp. HDW5A TaxID=2714926 RepID=UPI001C8704E9|nr:hypothetical protein [Dysgonomonas sp. HDW5A]